MVLIQYNKYSNKISVCVIIISIDDDISLINFVMKKSLESKSAEGEWTLGIE